MNCDYDPLKEYKKVELNKIAKKCGIPNAQKILKKDLINLLKMNVKQDTTNESLLVSAVPTVSSFKETNVQKCVNDLLTKCNIKSQKVKDDINGVLKKYGNILIPTNIEDVSSSVQTSVKITPEYEKDNYVAFSKYFRKELVGFIEKPDKIPKFRAFVPGGYGLKMVFEKKYNDNTKIKTKDLDITLSITDTKFKNPTAAKDYIVSKSREFIDTRNDPYNFKIQVITLPTIYNPILKMRRFYVVSILYKEDEFVDMALTDRDIKMDEMNIELSKEVLLPIKKDKGYFHEYFLIIYMENVPGVDHYCYLKRNPITGQFKCKGLKDIDRVKFLCEISNTKDKYKKECKLLKSVDKEVLQNMPIEKRDKLFVTLRKII